MPISVELPEAGLELKQTYIYQEPEDPNYSGTVMGVALVQSGGDGGTWLRVNQTGGTIQDISPTYFDDHPIWGNISQVTYNAQSMIRIPKFYIKTGFIDNGPNIGTYAYWISDIAREGFTLHPAFRSNGVEYDQFYIGKYQAGFVDGKLTSVPGVMPAANMTLSDMRTAAFNRNTGGFSGFSVWGCYQLSAIQRLLLIEHCTLNAQAVCGEGRVNATSVTTVSANDVISANYRGITGLWGNIWQRCDGIRTVDGKIEVWDRQGFRYWVATNEVPPRYNSPIYPTTFKKASGVDPNGNRGWYMHEHFFGETGTTVLPNSTCPSQQNWNATDTKFAVVGGGYNDGLHAGLCYIYCNYLGTDADSYIGCRLMRHG